MYHGAGDALGNRVPVCGDRGQSAKPLSEKYHDRRKLPKYGSHGIRGDGPCSGSCRAGRFGRRGRDSDHRECAGLSARGFFMYHGGRSVSYP